MSVDQQRPPFSETDAQRLAQALYGISGQIRELVSYADRNFHIKTDSGDEYVLKIANPQETLDNLDLQNKAMQHLYQHHSEKLYPRVCKAQSGEYITSTNDKNRIDYLVRLLTYLPGKPYADAKSHSPELLHELGMFLGQMDNTLTTFVHPNKHTDFDWHISSSVDVVNKYSGHITDSNKRTLVENHLEQYKTRILPIIDQLPVSFIHSDTNDYNILVANDNVTGLIDFGDVNYGPTSTELGITLAYLMLGNEHPLHAAIPIIRGYQQQHPLTDLELEAIYYFAIIRLCVSVCMSTYNQALDPENIYISIGAQPAWELLQYFAQIDTQYVCDLFYSACKTDLHLPIERTSKRTKSEILVIRDKFIGQSFSISYEKPLKIVRGFMQYLYDEEGRAYLDAVNNVPHVGHCHPYVVAAGQRQMAILNTNTRYLHDYLGEYARRLCAKFPDPLNVCYFVCSGSEANELALRLARTHSGKHDVMVLDNAYHGNTGNLVDMSPYKFDGPGGKGTPDYIHKVLMPDVYRGEYQASDPDVSSKYVKYVENAIEEAHSNGREIAAFFAETLLGCGGQIVLPEGYLKAAFEHARASGVVCVADEVQIGFGRVGSHFWGFETQNVIPDIVTMGKPMGNGHPLAAVVTTEKIAASFANGMEYFNTFGGNPVSCAIGMAVLDVIEQENLQRNALEVGNYLLDGLEALKHKYQIIGDVRGKGLYIGVELVRDHETLEPAAKEASHIIERMKYYGILISTDGPLHNVLKIKPPIIFTRSNARRLVNALDNILAEGLQ